MGVNFASIDKSADGDTFSVQSLVGDFQTEDQIQVWNGTGYETLVYIKVDGLQTGFYDATSQLSNLRLSRGSALWVRSKTAKAITIAGSVVTEDNSSVDCPKGWTLLAARKPVVLTVNGTLQISDLSMGDQIQVWDGSKYSTLVYITGVDGFKSGFYDEKSNYSNAEIAPGTAFWLQTVAGATVE